MVRIAPIVLMLMLSPMVLAQANQPAALFEAATRKAVVDGDLRQAITLYEQVVAHPSADRATAAKALLAIGEAHTKLSDGKAPAAYQRLMRDFGDQPAAASARARLGVAAAEAPQTLTAARVVEIGRPHDRISPDGRYLVRSDDNLLLYEIATKKTRNLTTDAHTTDPGHTYPLVSAFSRDGGQVAYQWEIEDEDRNELRVVRTAEGAGAPRILLNNRDVSFAPTDWSPDGKWIAGVARRDDRTAQIGLVSAADGSYRALKTVDWSRVGGVRFSPDSSLIAYHRPQKEGGFERDVFVIAADGSREWAAAATPGEDLLMEWSKDGQGLIIASDRGGSMSAWRVPGRGQTTTFTMVKPDIGIVSSIGMTRDGTIFYNARPSEANIYRANFDAAAGRLTSAPGLAIQQFKGLVTGAQWSPDGKLIAYASIRDIPAPVNVTRPIITIVSADTGALVRELHPPLSYGGMGKWSPDGKFFITFGADLKGRSGAIKIDAMTGEASIAGACSYIPYWAPDSQSFYCYQGKAKAIVQLDLTGKVLKTMPAEGQGAGVSPDGRFIVYGDGNPRVLRLLTIATGATREILPLTPPTTMIPRWNVSWMPDGKSVVFDGRIKGDDGVWIVPIDGSAPKKVPLDLTPVNGWSINPVTGQVLFGAGQAAPRLEVWKMENF